VWGGHSCPPPLTLLLRLGAAVRNLRSKAACCALPRYCQENVKCGVRGLIPDSGKHLSIWRNYTIEFNLMRTQEIQSCRTWPLGRQQPVGLRGGDRRTLLARASQIHQLPAKQTLRLRNRRAREKALHGRRRRFLAIYVIPADSWYIIPIEESSSAIASSPHNSLSQNACYKEAWDLLQRECTAWTGSVRTMQLRGTGVSALHAAEGTRATPPHPPHVPH
jgi:hypothetical protein